ncbi:lactoylglutathione lyase [Iodobacter arcticus]|uniref:lactoylglutathione lyase n=1 Tax=Iodobacter arcticus TaxID=590593 RepID=A0ABW2QSF7_9NEIS
MRLMHTMLRVADLDASIRFYQAVLGMQVLRRIDFSEGRFSLVYLGYGPESEQAAIELTWNWDKQDYTHGNYYGHIAIESDDIKGLCKQASELAYRVSRKPGPMKQSSAIIAFIEDPDGHQIELIQQGSL